MSLRLLQLNFKVSIKRNIGLYDRMGRFDECDREPFTFSVKDNDVGFQNNVQFQDVKFLGLQLVKISTH